jgi:acetyltransferase
MCCPTRPFSTRKLSDIPQSSAAQLLPAKAVEQWRTSRGAHVTIRAIQPEDAEIEQAFVRALSDEARFYRFFGTIKELAPAQLLRFTRIDTSREMALIAVHFEAGRETEVAVARYVTNVDGRGCEFAVVVADGWRRHGLAKKLMRNLMAGARAAGLETMAGDVLADNHAMLKLMKGLGFRLGRSQNDPALRQVSIALPAGPADGG